MTSTASAKAASGKRLRKKYDPNSWNTKLVVTRSNVLCLGVSYPCVRSQLRKFAPDLASDFELIYKEECVEQAVELVRRNFLTEMDGRDLARLLSLESGNDTMAYSVSMEKGASYSTRHLTANFNRNTFFREIKRVWGSIKFRQIILDYFWIPSGSWVMTHWSRAFFNNTIPRFVEEGVLEEGGIVYLPFCLHCVEQVVASIDKLKKYYNITFFYKWELQEHLLWKATQAIDPDSMQNWLGKAINQEETYCTFTARDVYSSKDNVDVRKEDLLDVLRGIEDFDQVRMIKLKSLRKGEKGGFFRLLQPWDVKRGLDHQPGARPMFAKKKRKPTKKVYLKREKGVETGRRDHVLLDLEKMINNTSEDLTKKCGFSQGKNKKDQIPKETLTELSKRQTSVHLLTNDVIMKKAMRETHPGNQQFMSLIRKHQPSYREAEKNSKDRSRIVSEIIKYFHSAKGRFVKEQNIGLFKIIDDRRTIYKFVLNCLCRWKNTSLRNEAEGSDNNCLTLPQDQSLCEMTNSDDFIPEEPASSSITEYDSIQLSLRNDDVVSVSKWRASHPGNLNFFSLIEQYQQKYQDGDVQEKKHLITSIISSIRPGRFLYTDKDDKLIKMTRRRSRNYISSQIRSSLKRLGVSKVQTSENTTCKETTTYQNECKKCPINEKHECHHTNEVEADNSSEIFRYISSEYEQPPADKIMEDPANRIARKYVKKKQLLVKNEYFIQKYSNGGCTDKISAATTQEHNHYSSDEDAQYDSTESSSIQSVLSEPLKTPRRNIFNNQEDRNTRKIDIRNKRLLREDGCLAQEYGSIAFRDSNATGESSEGSFSDHEYYSSDEDTDCDSTESSSIYSLSESSQSPPDRISSDKEDTISKKINNKNSQTSLGDGCVGQEYNNITCDSSYTNKSSSSQVSSNEYCSLDGVAEDNSTENSSVESESSEYIQPSSPRPVINCIGKSKKVCSSHHIETSGNKCLTPPQHQSVCGMTDYNDDSFKETVSNSITEPDPIRINLSDDDVVSRQHDSHPGNLHLFSLIQQRRQKYLDGTKSEKKFMISSIILSIRPGRFLAMKKHGIFEEMIDTSIRNYISVQMRMDLKKKKSEIPEIPESTAEKEKTTLQNECEMRCEKMDTSLQSRNSSCPIWKNVDNKVLDTHQKHPDKNCSFSLAKQQQAKIQSESQISSISFDKSLMESNAIRPELSAVNRSIEILSHASENGPCVGNVKHVQLSHSTNQGAEYDSRESSVPSTGSEFEPLSHGRLLEEPVDTFANENRCALGNESVSLEHDIPTYDAVSIKQPIIGLKVNSELLCIESDENSCTHLDSNLNPTVRECPVACGLNLANDNLGVDLEEAVPYANDCFPSKLSSSNLRSTIELNAMQVNLVSLNRNEADVDGIIQEMSAKNVSEENCRTSMMQFSSKKSSEKYVKEEPKQPTHELLTLTIPDNTFVPEMSRKTNTEAYQGECLRDDSKVINDNNDCMNLYILSKCATSKLEETHVKSSSDAAAIHQRELCTKSPDSEAFDITNMKYNQTVPDIVSFCDKKRKVTKKSEMIRKCHKSNISSHCSNGIYFREEEANLDITPNDNDIKTGKGFRASKDPTFLRHLQIHHEAYFSTLCKKKKLDIAQSIVDSIHLSSPPGRFLRRIDASTWEELSSEEAKVRVTNAFQQVYEKLNYNSPGSVKRQLCWDEILLMRGLLKYKVHDDVGNDTWVKCDRCSKWRFLPLVDVSDSHRLPSLWYCELNDGDVLRNRCDSPQMLFESKNEVWEAIIDDFNLTHIPLKELKTLARSKSFINYYKRIKGDQAEMIEFETMSNAFKENKRKMEFLPKPRSQLQRILCNDRVNDVSSLVPAVKDHKWRAEAWTEFISRQECGPQQIFCNDQVNDVSYLISKFLQAKSQWVQMNTTNSSHLYPFDAYPPLISPHRITTIPSSDQNLPMWVILLARELFDETVPWTILKNIPNKLCPYKDAFETNHGISSLFKNLRDFFHWYEASYLQKKDEKQDSEIPTFAQKIFHPFGAHNVPIDQNKVANSENVIPTFATNNHPPIFIEKADTSDGNFIVSLDQNSSDLNKSQPHPLNYGANQQLSPVNMCPSIEKDMESEEDNLLQSRQLFQIKDEEKNLPSDEYDKHIDDCINRNDCLFDVESGGTRKESSNNENGTKSSPSLDDGMEEGEIGEDILSSPSEGKTIHARFSRSGRFTHSSVYSSPSESSKLYISPQSNNNLLHMQSSGHHGYLGEKCNKSSYSFSKKRLSSQMNSTLPDYHDTLEYSDRENTRKKMCNAVETPYWVALNKVVEMQHSDKVFTSEVVAIKRGGVICRVEGLDAFLPLNHIMGHTVVDELIGRKLPLKILRIDREKNHIIVSQKRVWEKVTEMQNNDEIFESEVIAINEWGDVICLVEGFQALLPSHHLLGHNATDDLIGQKLPLKFLKLNYENISIRVSNKRAVEEQKMSDFSCGDLIFAVVESINIYGAFLTVGKENVFLHISQISSAFIHDLGKVLKSGDRIKCILIQKFSDGRIIVSTKMLERESGDMLKNPARVFELANEARARYKAWEKVIEMQNDGKVIRSEVVAIERDGFTCLVEGLSSFLPMCHLMNHIDVRRLIGQKLPLKILSVDREKNLIIVSHRRAWEKVTEMQNNDDVFESEVISINEWGDVICLVEGFQALLPSHHLLGHNATDDLIGQKLPLKFLEVNRENISIRVSNKRAVEEQKMSDSSCGDLIFAVVERIYISHAVLAVGKEKVSLHVSHISSAFIHDLGKVLKSGDRIKCILIQKFSDGQIIVSTKMLERESGEMLKNPARVFELANETAARYKKSNTNRGSPLQSSLVRKRKAGELSHNVVTYAKVPGSRWIAPEGKIVSISS